MNPQRITWPIVTALVLASCSGSSVGYSTAPSTTKSERCDITLFGAIDGNRTTDAQRNSQAIHAALNLCDHIFVPASRIFKVAPLILRSNKILELEHGSALVGSDNWTHYGATRFMPPLGTHMQLQPLLSAVNASNITIFGANGTLDGNGWYAWPAANWSSSECGLHRRCAPNPFFGVKQGHRFFPPHLLTFIRCVNVKISNITIKNPPFWGLQHFFCNHSKMDHLTILAPRWTRQIAGFMPWSVIDYVVEDSYVHVGDDAVAIMSGNDEDGHRWTTASVVFRRLYVRGRSVAIGSAVSGNVTDILFENCTIGDDAGSSPWAFKIKMHANDPSIVSGVHFKNTKLGNITSNTWQDPNCYPAIEMGMNYDGAYVDPEKHQPQIRNISFVDVNTTYTCGAVGSLIGIKKDAIAGLHFEDCNFHTRTVQPWKVVNVSISSCSSLATLPPFP